MRRALAAFLLAAAAAAALPAAAGSDTQAAGIEKREAAEFYQRLQEALAADDVETIADMVKYPLRYGNADSADEPSELAAAAQLHERYHDIFTPPVKRVIACRMPGDFFANSEGIMVGGGALWFARVFTGDSAAARPIDYWDSPAHWPLRVIAVYDGRHARQDAELCEKKKQTQKP